MYIIYGEIYLNCFEQARFYLNLNAFCLLGRGPFRRCAMRVEGFGAGPRLGIRASYWASATRSPRAGRIF